MAQPTAVAQYAGATDAQFQYLHGPGPVTTSPAALRAGARPMLNHMGPAFTGMVDNISAYLREITGMPHAYPISATGSGAMDFILGNYVQQGDEIAVVKNGEFGGRAAKLLGQLGAKVHLVEVADGKSNDLEGLKTVLEDHNIEAVVTVHGETSVGYHERRMGEISKLAHDYEALSIVDCVTTLGGSDVHVDTLGHDAFWSGSQKCLSVSPGASPVGYNDAFLDRVMSREGHLPTWTHDIAAVSQYMEADAGRKYHHTPNVTGFRQLESSLAAMAEEGFGQVIERHQANGQLFQQAVTQWGFTYLADSPLPQLHAVAPPEGVTPQELIAYLADPANNVADPEHGIVIATGLPPNNETHNRIGFMGFASDQRFVEMVLGTMDNALQRR